MNSSWIFVLIRDPLVHLAIPEYVENWVLSVHRAREAHLVTLDGEVPKEKTDLKALVVHLVPSETKVCPVLVELKEKRETLVRRVQSALLALLENKDHLVPKVFKVCPEHLDQKEIRDLKVKQETLDHPDLQDKMELT